MGERQQRQEEGLSNDEDEESRRRRQRCLATAARYQSKFANTVQPLSSTDLVSGHYTPLSPSSSSPPILVDVRTQAERNVSMIPSAITLEECYKLLDDSTNDSSTNHDTADGKTTVICYCTTGYRSGLTARRLQRQFSSSVVEVYNLDGIVAYTHAISNLDNNDDGALALINVTTGTGSGQQQRQPTRNVHVFGRIWDNLPDGYTAFYFDPFSFASHTAQVGWLATIHHAQSGVDFVQLRCCCCCCCFQRRQRPQQERQERRTLMEQKSM